MILKSRLLQICALVGIFALALTHRVKAEILEIGIGLSMPPYVIQKTDRGIENDIIREALAHVGYGVKFRYMPLRRIVHAMNAGRLDGALHLNRSIPVQGYYSDEMILYNNYAISRAEDQLDIVVIPDLEPYRVVGFQNAQNYLGRIFAQTTDRMAEYSEVAQQLSQVKMLEAGRVDVVISDYRIFLHFKEQCEQTTGRAFDVIFHRLFAPSRYSAAFKDYEVREAFNVGLRWLRETGRYQEIIAHYTQDLSLQSTPRF